MRHRPPFVASLLLVAGAATLWAATARPGGAPARPSADLPAAERLASLAGEWTILDAEGRPTDLRATYAVVGGGAAIAETMLLGTDEETFTLYQVEGPIVTATQVSPRGLPIRLLPRASEDPRAIRLESDATRPRDGELAAIELFAEDDAHLQVTWSFAQADAEPRERALHLQRDETVAALRAEVSRVRTRLDSLERELDRRLRREVRLEEDGSASTVVETRTLPPGPGWSVTGTPMAQFLQGDVRFASTYAEEGDAGMTVAHYGFRVGADERVSFSVLGGHAYIALVDESRAPPRRIKDIPAFSAELLRGDHGTVLRRVIGERWTTFPAAVEWDLSELEGHTLRVYVVDAVSDHFGQIAISTVTLRERASAKR